MKKTGSTISINSVDSFMDDSIISIEDKQNALANAECIALKCEEVGCQFITAWDSEMQRHLSECHAPITVSKPRKPLPNLIPLKLANSPPNNTPSNNGPPTTLLKVPRVRVRPELAQIARDTELAKMYANKEVGFGSFFCVGISNAISTLIVSLFSGDKFEERRGRFIREKERLLFR